MFWRKGKERERGGAVDLDDIIRNFRWGLACKASCVCSGGLIGR